MEPRIFTLLGISPKSSAEAISQAYWSRVRTLRGAGARDLEAARAIDELNDAYQRYSRTEAFAPRPKPQPSPWPRRVFTGALVVVLIAGGIEALQYRGDIADAGSSAARRAQTASDRGINWVQEQFATPTPTVRFYRIGDTGGTGVWLRLAPSYDARGTVLLRDGAPLAATGDQATVAGERWLRVRTPAAADGWISERWLTAP
jgi:hypothetical protein